MRINEKGRSMIEMLGVLAIIGVLSVGGIAGYSKAMAKFKVNKTIDQVAHTVANTRILFSSQRNYGDLGKCAASETGSNDGGKTLIEDTKLLPDSLKGFVNAYGGDFHLCDANRLNSSATDEEGDKRAFILMFTGLPTEACVDLATQDWNAASGSGLIAMGVIGESAANGTNSISKYTDFAKATTCTKTATAPAQNAATTMAYACGDDTDPMSISVATAACKSAYSTIYFKFY